MTGHPEMMEIIFSSEYSLSDIYPKASAEASPSTLHARKFLR